MKIKNIKLVIVIISLTVSFSGIIYTQDLASTDMRFILKEQNCIQLGGFENTALSEFINLWSYYKGDTVFGFPKPKSLADEIGYYDLTRKGIDISA